MPNPTFSALTSDIERNPEILDEILDAMEAWARRKSPIYRIKVTVNGAVTTVRAVDA